MCSTMPKVSGLYMLALEKGFIRVDRREGWRVQYSASKDGFEEEHRNVVWKGSNRPLHLKGRKQKPGLCQRGSSVVGAWIPRKL